MEPSFHPQYNPILMINSALLLFLLLNSFSFGESLLWVRSDPMKYLQTSTLKGEELDKLRDEDGRSPMMLACELLNPSLVQALLARKASASLPDSEGNSPLHYALLRPNLNQDPKMKEDRESILAILFREKVNPDAPNAQGITPLMLAVANQELESIEVLVGAGASVNRTDPDGETPLMGAVGIGNVRVVELLLRLGARVDLADKNGTTALDLLPLETSPLRLLLEDVKKSD